MMQFELLGKLLRVTEEDSHPAVIRTHLFLPPKAHLPLPPSYHFLWNPQGTPGSSGFLWFLYMSHGDSQRLNTCPMPFHGQVAKFTPKLRFL